MISTLVSKYLFPDRYDKVKHSSEYFTSTNKGSTGSAQKGSQNNYLSLEVNLVAKSLSNGIRAVGGKGFTINFLCNEYKSQPRFYHLSFKAIKNRHQLPLFSVLCKITPW